MLLKDFLTDQNPQVRRATCELLSNLSLSDTVITMAEEENELLIQMSKLMVSNLKGAIQEQFEVIEYLRAVLGFFANLARFETVRKQLLDQIDKSLIITALHGPPEIVHRLVYIAEDFLEGDKVNIFYKVPDSVNLLKKHVGDKTTQLNALCEYFVNLLEGNIKM